MSRPSDAVFALTYARSLKVTEYYHTDEVSHQCVVFGHVRTHCAATVVLVGDVADLHIHIAERKVHKCLNNQYC